jgi:hypothetical protein
MMSDKLEFVDNEPVDRQTEVCQTPLKLEGALI